MSLFGLFGSKNPSEEKEEKNIPWRRLVSMEQLKEIIEVSKGKPVAIFKHSTRCGISRMVIKQFESEYDLTDEQLQLYYLDLLSFRDISSEVGITFQVLHESPQLLVIKNGVSVYHASHSAINARKLAEFV
ncbi:bacillithiol system redox-active protein YtxJ [Ulvibacter litoralis]|uniref:Bacillithiol system protein YtxJ n=1 Tax=Ulvibacter litoralis TaxID=227084 RepID=A0A1G7I0F5_9FLAO|nr:bacillithiol system redox-active protein YtxJ [Ulvibacter litoralis]GHC62882.1 thioredoxin family protein [Ulvibacter litoralis]SDF06212.1 bacillithiol system protein YtxJ [Ulvibacter litoralis]